MAGPAVRRAAAAMVVLLALLMGVGLFVGVWLLGDAGGDDPGPDASVRARDPVGRTADETRSRSSDTPVTPNW